MRVISCRNSPKHPVATPTCVQYHAETFLHTQLSALGYDKPLSQNTSQRDVWRPLQMTLIMCWRLSLRYLKTQRPKLNGLLIISWWTSSAFHFFLRIVETRICWKLFAFIHQHYAKLSDDCHCFIFAEILEAFALEMYYPRDDLHFE